MQKEIRLLFTLTNVGEEVVLPIIEIVQAIISLCKGDVVATKEVVYSANAEEIIHDTTTTPIPHSDTAA